MGLAQGNLDSSCLSQGPSVLLKVGMRPTSQGPMWGKSLSGFWARAQLAGTQHVSMSSLLSSHEWVVVTASIWTGTRLGNVATRPPKGGL